MVRGRKLKIIREYASIFHNPKHLVCVTITGTRIRKPDFHEKLTRFMNEIQR